MSNINSKAQIIKRGQQDSAFELGVFTNSTPNSLANTNFSHSLNDKSINGNIDPTLQGVEGIAKQLELISQKISDIENDGIKGRDLDKQVVDGIRDLKQHTEFFEQAALNFEANVLKTALKLANKIVQIELADKSAQIAKTTLEPIMKKIQSASKVEIKLNPKDFLLLKDDLQLGANVHLLEDANVTLGGVIVSSDLGNFDGSVEAKVQAIMQLCEDIS
jgi:flagellar assembly protein FliH